MGGSHTFLKDDDSIFKISFSTLYAIVLLVGLLCFFVLVVKVSAYNVSYQGETLIISQDTPIQCFDWSPDSSTIVTGSSDYDYGWYNGKICLWNATTGNLVKYTDYTQKGVESISWSPWMDKIAFGTSYGKIDIVSTKDFANILEISAHQREVRCVSWSPDGRHIVSWCGDYDASLGIWNAETGNSTGEVYVGCGIYGPLAFEWNSNGTKFAVIGEDESLDKNMLMIYNISDSKVFSLVPVYSNSLTWSLDDTKLAATIWSEIGYEICVWESSSGRLLKNFSAQLLNDSIDVNYVAWSPNDDRMAVLSVFSGSMRIWNMKTGQLEEYFNSSDYVTFIDDNVPSKIRWSPDGTKVAWKYDEHLIIHAVKKSNNSYENHPPVIDKIETQYVTVGNPFEYTVSALDPELDVVSYSDDSPLFDIGSQNGTIYFVPIATGNYTIKVTATDGKETSSMSFSLNVVGQEPAPEIKKLYSIKYLGGVAWANWTDDSENIRITLYNGTTFLWNIVTNTYTNQTHPNYSSDKNSELIAELEALYQSLGFTGLTDTSPDGRKKVFISSEPGPGWFESHNYSLHIINVQTNENITIATNENFSYSFAWSPDGRMLAAGVCEEFLGIPMGPSTDNNLYIWNTSSGALVKTFTGHNSSIFFVAWSPDGTKIVTSSFDNTSRVWDTVSGNTIFSIDGGDSMVAPIVWSPDGTKLVTSTGGYLLYALSATNTNLASIVKMWDPTNGNLLKNLSCHDDQVVTLLWPQGSPYLVSSSFNLTRVWDTTTFTAVNDIRHLGEPVIQFNRSKDNSRILFHTPTKIKVFDTSNWVEKASLTEGHTSKVIKLAWSKDGTKFATADDGDIVKIWNYSTGTLISEINTMRQLESIFQGSNYLPLEDLQSIEWSPDGNIIAIGFETNVLILWDIKNEKVVNTFHGSVERTYLDTTAWSPDGNRIAIGFGSSGESYRGGVQIYIIGNGTCMMNQSIDGYVYSIAWSSDGRRLFAGTEKGWIVVLDTENYTFLKRIYASNSKIKSIACLPDGGKVAFGTPTEGIKIIDTETGLVTKRLLNSTMYFEHIYWISGTETIAAVYTATYNHGHYNTYSKRSVGLWSSRTGAMLENLTMDAPILSFAMFGDGASFLVSLEDNCNAVEVWGNSLFRSPLTASNNMTVVNSTSPPITNNPPTVAITSKFPDKVSGAIIIAGTSSDDVSVQYIEIKIGSDYSVYVTNATASWNYSLDTTKLADGKHTIKIRAYDGMQYSTEQSLEIDIKNAKGTNEQKKESKGFIPGFEFITIVIGLGIWIIVRRKKI